MNKTPFELTKQKKPYVLAFLAELTTNKQEEYSIVPSRYLCFIFNAWCDRRKFESDLKMNQQRFTYVMRLLGYTSSRRTRVGIGCFNVTLLDQPLAPTEYTKEALGATDLAPFTFPDVQDVPPTIYNEIAAVRHTINLMDRDKRVREESWGAEGKQPSNLSLKPTPQAKEAEEPNFEQIEADEVVADASNEYDA